MLIQHFWPWVRWLVFTFRWGNWVKKPPNSQVAELGFGSRALSLLLPGKSKHRQTAGMWSVLNECPGHCCFLPAALHHVVSLPHHLQDVQLSYQKVGTPGFHIITHSLLDPWFFWLWALEGVPWPECAIHFSINTLPCSPFCPHRRHSLAAPQSGLPIFYWYVNSQIKSSRLLKGRTHTHPKCPSFCPNCHDLCRRTENLTD